MATATYDTGTKAKVTTVSITLYRIGAVRNADGLGGQTATEKRLTLTANSIPQLRAMQNIAAVDGWHKKGA